MGTGSEYLTTYTDQDSGNNLALAGTSLKTPLPATTGDKTGEFTVPSSGQSLVEIHFHCDESDIDRSDDFRFWILDENRDTTNGAIAVAAYKANSGSSYYKYRNAISWSGYIAPGGKFSVYIQAITPTAACEVQGSVKITTYDV